MQGGLEIPVKFTVRMEVAREIKPWKGSRSWFNAITKSRQTANLMTAPKKCCLISSRRAVTKRSMSHNPLTGYWAIVFDIVNVVVANIDFLSFFVALKVHFLNF